MQKGSCMLTISLCFIKLQLVKQLPMMTGSTKKEFDDFFDSPAYIAAHSGSTIPFPTTSATGVQQPKTKDPVLEFKHGIKRDNNLSQPSRKISNGMHGREQQ